MDLFAATNMAEVESDPNNIPDNIYDGVISSSSFVYSANKDILQHVINYKVTEGPHKGADRGEFFRILDKPRLGNGQPPQQGRVTIDQIASGTPLMNDNNKKWYRLRIEEITGAKDDASVAKYMNQPDLLAKLPVTFGLKRNAQGFPNISFARKRNESSTPQGLPTSLGAPVAFGTETRPAPDFAQPTQPVGNAAQTNEPAAAPTVPNQSQDPWTVGAPTSLEGF